MSITSIEYDKELDRKRLKFILDNLKSNIPLNGRVLDVGCGNGIISINLGKNGYNVHGIDVSEKAIMRAKENNSQSNVKFEVISAESLVAKGHQYDAVICSEVLEHLDDPSILLRTIHASLKDEGILIVTVPNGQGPRELLITRPMLSLRSRNGLGWKTTLKLKSLLGYSGSTIQSDAEDLDHVQFFTKKLLEELAGKNSFEIKKFSKTIFMADVFPMSFFANRIRALQKLDAFIADYLPYRFSGGFNTVWKKSI